MRGASLGNRLTRRRNVERQPAAPAAPARNTSSSDVGRQCLRADNKGGQAMVEYLVMTGIFLASLAILALFLVTFREYGYRILEMVGSDYP
jgi:hypothetical protein